MKMNNLCFINRFFQFLFCATKVSSYSLCWHFFLGFCVVKVFLGSFFVMDFSMGFFCLIFNELKFRELWKLSDLFGALKAYRFQWSFLSFLIKTFPVCIWIFDRAFQSGSLESLKKNNGSPNISQNTIPSFQHLRKKPIKITHIN